jgi:hypothetical protein
MGSVLMFEKFKFKDEVNDVLKNAKSVTVVKTRDQLLGLALGGGQDKFVVQYDVNGKVIDEVTVVKCKNGAAVNYCEDYMRRRDPDCLIVGDDLPTDKPRFEDEYKQKFAPLRKDTFEWLKTQDLIIVPVLAGGDEYGYEVALIAPKNAAFFGGGLADLQYFINIDEYKKATFEPKCVIYLAPPYRHTHFGGKQIVVHNRLPDVYELFSYNLYPGPSAKKGIYGFLLYEGEREGWVTAHAAAVKVVTPYDNELVIMHEGASGGGKSEMGENIHREPNGKVCVSTNVNTGEKFYINFDNCGLELISDDMALCHPKMQNNSGKLVIKDAEAGWFLRVDHIKEYGVEPFREKTCIHPKEPLIFINLQGEPNSSCLLWEHTIDSNGKPCPNPRVIMPRRLLGATIVDDPIEVDIRSFGVRTPPCTKANPTYGIMGMVHILPPALAWLWRLVAPRGHANPSIVDREGLQSEGVGSYWPFLAGKVVSQAKLLLEQIVATPNTRYVLIPNQHIGVYKVGFNPQWIAREYIARRGSAKFKQEHLIPARMPALGYCLDSLRIDGQYIPQGLLRPEMQPEVGVDAYDKGSKILAEFITNELKKIDMAGLPPLGKKIIETFYNNGSLQDYMDLIPMRF